MPETTDPVAALGAKDIPTRAAGARDLALTGEPGHVTRLLELALRDVSPGVRLGAAAAAADILSRWRLPPRADAIPAQQRAAWLALVASADPGQNPGLFQVCGVVGTPAAAVRIVGGLRDPRADVRTGACVGLGRLLASAAANGDAELQAQVRALFDDPRVRPETRAEVARICANVGWGFVLEFARELSAATQKVVAAPAAEAVSRLEWPAPAEGLWTDLGLDAGAVDPGATEPIAWVAVVDGQRAVVADATGARPEPLGAPPRRLWMKRPGATEASLALQIGLRTLWPADADEIGAFGERLLELGAPELLEVVDPLLPHTAATVRLRGVARLHAGDVPGAVEILSAAVEMKKVPADTWWWLADALHRAGRADEARPHLEKYLGKVPKKAPYAAEARKRLGIQS